MFRCPADVSTVRGYPGLPRTRSYSLSVHLNGTPNENGIGPSPLSNFALLTPPGPASVLVLVDEDADCIENSIFGLTRYPDNHWLNLPAERHGRAGTLSYADGHVIKKKWRWLKKFQGYSQPAANSQHLDDLRDLQAGIPVNSK